MTYLFRGKSVEPDRPGWVYGDVSHCEGWTYITPIETNESDGSESIMVDPDSVGIWTGLEDKNGKKIFEGDTFKKGDSHYRYLVEFKNGCFGCETTHYGWKNLSEFVEIEVIHEGEVGE